MTEALRQSRPLRRSWAGDLDAATLYELLRLRVEVFVVEQRCPYPELDGQDLLAGTRHFWFEDADGRVIATLRLIEDHRQARNGYQESLRGVVAEQSAANAKLIVCLDNNTKVLEECRDELRSVRMERNR